MKTVDEISSQTDVPVVVVDQDGAVTYINEKFSSIFGWSREELVGQALSCIIPKALRDAHQLGFSRFIATGKPRLLNQPLKLRTLAKDGRECDTEHFIVAERWDGRWTFAATIRLLG